MAADAAGPSSSRGDKNVNGEEGRDDGRLKTASQRCAMSDPRNWLIFRNVSPQLIDHIRLFYVFGEYGADVIFVTDDDQVYVYGLGADHDTSCEDKIKNQSQPVFIQPQRLPDLDSGKVVQFTYGPDRILMRFDSGKVFRFAYGDWVTDRDNRNWEYSYFFDVDASLRGKAATDIACGLGRSFAVTADGQVYGWKCNPRWLADDDSRIVAALDGGRVTSIACVYDTRHTLLFALTDDGRVYALRDDRRDRRAAKVVGLTVRIAQLACTSSHCLALSQEGNIYAWNCASLLASRAPMNGGGHVAWNAAPNDGWNNDSDGEEPVADNWGQPLPHAWAVPAAEHAWAKEVSNLKIFKLPCSNSVVAELAADNGRCAAAALTRDGLVYVLRPDRKTATPTPFSSLQEAFSFYAQPSVTYKPVVVDKSIGGDVCAALRHAFDDRSSADMTIVVGGQSIHVHRALLIVRSDYFRTMFAGAWKESTGGIVEIKDYSFTAYRSFLRYLYSDDVDIDTEHDLIDLLDLAKCYCEDALKSRCETLLKQSVTVDNVADLHTVAVTYDATALREFCLNFAASNIHTVTQKRAYGALAGDALKDFFAEVVKRISK